MLFAAYGGSIAATQGDAVHIDVSTNHVDPCGAIRTETIRNLDALCQLRHEHVRVLVDSDRAVAVRRSCQAFQPVLLFLRIKANLLITRFRSSFGGLDPDLEEMQPLALGGIELAVPDTCPGGHALNFIRSKSLLMTHAVLMG